MGCWNGTCMVTQLPIKDNEPIVMIPIVKVSEISLENCCYSNDYFKPFPIVLYGQYDDYGCATDITGDVKQFMNIVDKAGQSTSEDVEDYYKRDYGVREIPLIEKYLRYIERNMCPKINFIMIHKEIYDKLKTYHGFYCSIDDIVNETYLWNNKSMISDCQLRPGRLFNSSDSTFANIKVLGATKESIKEIMCLNSALGLLRKMWMPQTGAGGQSDIEEPHRIICDFYDEYINSSYYANSDEEEEEYEEDEEEN